MCINRITEGNLYWIRVVHDDIQYQTNVTKKIQAYHVQRISFMSKYFILALLVRYKNAVHIDDKCDFRQHWH